MKRYPLEPLFAAMGMSPNQACMSLGVAGSTQQKYRAEGVIERTAEMLATRAGFHVFEIWPEMVEDRLDDCSLPCEDCGTPFLPTRKGHRFCSTRCQHRAVQRINQRRRYWTDPDYRERKLAKIRAERATPAPPAVVRARRAKAAAARARKREDYNAAAREWYWANRDEYNARRRERYAAKKAS
jgi:hypothetical protein